MHTCMPPFCLCEVSTVLLGLTYIWHSLSSSLSTCIPNHLPCIPYLFSFSLLLPHGLFPLHSLFSLPCCTLYIPILFLSYLLTFFFLSHSPSFAFLFPSPLFSSLFPITFLSPSPLTLLPSPSPISYSLLPILSPSSLPPSFFHLYIAYFYSGVKFVYAENLPTYKSVRRSFNKLMSLLENKG